MMTSSYGNIFRVTGPLCGEFIGHWWIPQSKGSGAELWCFFYLRLIKRLSKQSWGWWFETSSCSLWRHWNIETPSCSLWRHCNEKGTPYLDLTDELCFCIYIYRERERGRERVVLTLNVKYVDGSAKKLYFLHTGLIPDIRLFCTYTLIYQREFLRL